MCRNGRGKKVSVHRLVAQAFIYNEKPNVKIQVNHINGIKHDNRVENLEWVTNQENMNHRMLNGLNNPAKGEKNNFSKLKNEQVIDIYTSTKTYKELQEEYNISCQTIRKIKKQISWQHITKNYSVGKVSTNRLDKEEIEKIYLAKGKYKDIATTFNVHEDTVSRIKNGKVHKEITERLSRRIY